MSIAQQSIRAPRFGPAPTVGCGTDRRRSTPLSGASARAVELLSALEGGAISLSLPGRPSRLLGHGEEVAEWRIHDDAALVRILGAGDIAFGETFVDGLWDSDDPVALIGLLSRNRAVLKRAIYGRPMALVRHWLHHRLRANSRRGARRNIAAHYDLGNAFYASWLDRTMTYSSALFEQPSESLADAQLRKYRRILHCLQPRPGQTILEIGCGWGGFAEVAAAEFGCRVLGLTLSREQLDYARRRARRAGVADLAQFELCDYRAARGSFDHIVSVEMFEAVGERYWPVWFGQLGRLLKPGGKALVQSITIADALFPAYRRGTDFIQRYIFPGGMLPSAQAFRRSANRAGFAVADDFAFGPHYANTLARWRRAFDDHPEAHEQRGFDVRFRRLWHFYLAYCEAGFRTGDLDVHQFELRRAT